MQIAEVLFPSHQSLTMFLSRLNYLVPDLPGNLSQRAFTQFLPIHSSNYWALLGCCNFVHLISRLKFHTQIKVATDYFAVLFYRFPPLPSTRAQLPRERGDLKICLSTTSLHRMQSVISKPLTAQINKLLLV